jgi:hypothetical protein
MRLHPSYHRWWVDTCAWQRWLPHTCGVVEQRCDAGKWVHAFAEVTLAW